MDYVLHDEAKKRAERERRYRKTGVLGSVGGESSVESLEAGEEKKAEDVEALKRSLDMWVLDPAGGMPRPATVGGGGGRMGGAQESLQGARPRTGGRPGGRRSGTGGAELGQLKPLAYNLTQTKGIEKSWKKVKSDQRRMEGMMM